MGLSRLSSMADVWMSEAVFALPFARGTH